MKTWLTGFLTSLVGILTLIAGALAYVTLRPMNPPPEEVSASHQSEAITALERQEQIVLLSTSTQGLMEGKKYTNLFGRKLPGSSRTQFLQYSYRAKLGIEGSEVDIEQVGENRYLVSVPSFVFIGYEDPHVETVVEQWGALSFATAQIDTTESINRILDPEMKTGHIEDNLEILQDQTRVFSTGIIHGIDGDIELDFEFKKSS